MDSASSLKADFTKTCLKVLFMVSSSAAVGLPAVLSQKWVSEVPVPLCIAASAFLVFSAILFLFCFTGFQEDFSEEKEADVAQKSPPFETKEGGFEEKSSTIPPLVLSEIPEKVLAEKLSISPPQVRFLTDYSPETGSSVTTQLATETEERPKKVIRSRRKSMPCSFASREMSPASTCNSSEGMMPLRRSSRLRNRLKTSPLCAMR